jgi:glutathione S-transferase
VLARDSAEVVTWCVVIGDRRLEKVVADNGGEYVAGTSNTYGDVAVFNFANQVAQLKADALEGYPSLQAIKARIGAIPAVAEYLTPSA